MTYALFVAKLDVVDRMLTLYLFIFSGIYSFYIIQIPQQLLQHRITSIHIFTGNVCYKDVTVINIKVGVRPIKGAPCLKTLNTSRTSKSGVIIK